MATATRVACVILAGGVSSRMGRPKALLETDDGRGFLEHIATSYREAGVRERVLVLNSELAKGPSADIARAQGLWVVVNNTPWLGKWHSLRLGMSALRDATYCFLQHVDQPGVDRAVLWQLREAANESGYTVPVHSGRGGHPILLSRPIIHRLASLEADNHLRELLQGYPRTEVQVGAPGVLVDINTPEDYAAFRTRATVP